MHITKWILSLQCGCGRLSCLLYSTKCISYNIVFVHWQRSAILVRHELFSDRGGKWCRCLSTKWCIPLLDEYYIWSHSEWPGKVLQEHEIYDQNRKWQQIFCAESSSLYELPRTRYSRRHVRDRCCSRSLLFPPKRRSIPFPIVFFSALESVIPLQGS